MSHHDGRIKRSEIKCCNWDLVEALDGINDRSSLVLLVRSFNLHGGNEQVFRHGLAVQLRNDLDLLATGKEIVEWDTSDTGHFHVINQTHEFVQQTLGKVGVLSSISTVPNTWPVKSHL